MACSELIGFNKNKFQVPWFSSVQFVILLLCVCLLREIPVTQGEQSVPYTAGYIDQYVDHYNFAKFGNKTFKQRYLIQGMYFKKKSITRLERQTCVSVYTHYLLYSVFVIGTLFRFYTNPILGYVIYLFIIIQNRNFNLNLIFLGFLLVFLQHKNKIKLKNEDNFGEKKKCCFSFISSVCNQPCFSLSQQFKLD